MTKTMLNSANEHQRFSIRKLTIGAASVLIGAVFYLNNGGESVQATTENDLPDTTVVQSDENTNRQEQQTHDTASESAQGSNNSDATEDNSDSEQQSSNPAADKTKQTTQEPEKNNSDKQQQPETNPAEKDSSKTDKPSLLALYATDPNSRHQENEPTKLDNSDYSVSSQKVTAIDGTAQNPHAGYENAHFDLEITNTNDAANKYLDISLGLPYQDKDGHTKVEAYDDHLATENQNIYVNNDSSASVGTITAQPENKNYRIVFNDHIKDFTSPVITLDLKWSNGQLNDSNGNNQIAGVNDPKRVYAYKSTDDPDKNGTTDTFKPDNDLQIGDKTFSSGLDIRYAYVYNKPYQSEYKGETDLGALGYNNRTWRGDTDQVNISDRWANNINLIASSKDLSNDFTFTLKVPKNTNLFTYEFNTPETIIENVKRLIDIQIQHSLSDEVTGQPSYFINDDISRTHSPNNPDVTCTITNSNTDTDYIRTYHITIPENAKFRNIGDGLNPADTPFPDISLATVTSLSPFGIPAGVKNYQEDLDKKVSYKQNNGTYYEQTSSNEAAVKFLQHHPYNITFTKGLTLGQNESGIGDGQWHIFIAQTLDPNLNWITAGDTTTGTLSFYDKDNSRLLDTVSISELTGSNISFQNSTDPTKDAESILNQLKNNGYQLVKVVAVNGNDITTLTSSDSASLDEVNFGLLTPTNKTFKVYVEKTAPSTDKDAKAYLVYYDDDAHQFITRESNGNYTPSADINQAYKDSFTGTAESHIQFGNSVYEILTGNQYKYVYVGISTENGAQLVAINSQNAINSTPFARFNFGQLDNDPHSSQFFIVHLKHASPGKVIPPTEPNTLPTDPKPTQPTTLPTDPQPTQPTQSSVLPEQPTSPTEPVQPTIQQLKATKKITGWNANNKPHSEQGKRRSHRYNYNMPKSNNNNHSNITPHGAVLRKTATTNMTTSAKRQTRAHLPATGENKSSLAIFGLGLAVVSGLISLAIYRKRKN